MADFLVHISQAEHNESLADYLLSQPYYDWSITAYFYSAIHYFEARLFIRFLTDSEKHSDTNVPSNISVHSWREKLVQKYFSQNVWMAFRKLREASETARYLAISPNSASQFFLSEPSYKYFQNKDAINFKSELNSIKNGFKIELTKFLYQLDMDKIDPIIASNVKAKLLNSISSKEEVLLKSNVTRYLSRNEANFFEKCLTIKGFEFR